MDRNNIFQFDYRRYKELLSPFGQKVFDVLLDVKRNEYEHNFKNKTQKRNVPARSDKVITYSKDTTKHDREDLMPAFLDFTHNDSSTCIPTAVELLNRTVTDNADHNDFNALDKAYKHVNEPFNQNITNFFDNDGTSTRLEPINRNIKRNDITWNDMFDTELFEGIAVPVIDDLINKKLVVNEINKDKAVGASPEKTTSNFDFFEIDERENSQSPKCKLQTEATDPKTNKTKKMKSEIKNIVIKNNFRKERYTKTVKNWLENVDPNNPVEDQVVKFGKGEINANNKTTKKKTIQTQLANKGGVMKFTTPKTNTKYNAEKSDVKENKTANSNIVKEKKMKSKFMAPIKSQLPTVDVTYDIRIITEENIEEFTYELQFTGDSEIVIIVAYSNGFCQLNNQYTDDNCIPEGVLIEINNRFYYLKEPTKLFGSAIMQILKHKVVICYEGKNLLIYLASRIDVDLYTRMPNIIDAKIGASLLDPDEQLENFCDLQKLVAFTPDFTIATDCVLQKAAWYMILLKECAVKLRTLLIEHSSWKVFVDIEMKLLPIIADMEYRGVRINLTKLKSMEDCLVNEMKKAQQKCYEAAGKVFQINSTVQVRTILYEELQLDSKGNVKIKETSCKGAKSTSETMLRSLGSVHPLPKLILEYRRLHKAYATFLTGISQHIKDGIVRPIWVQTAATTGRIASNNPNLQAIPKAPFSLLSSAGDEDGKQVLNFRSIYTCREGHMLLAADFKHVECRVFAYAASDCSLLDALHSEDIFRVLAAKWLQKAESEVCAEDRERTKRIVYASLYGAGARKLMDILDVSYDQALSVSASFNRTFPSLKQFGRSIISQCEQKGGSLSTLCGRSRRFRNISSNDFSVKSHAERQAVNFIVQGTAADLCKLAMILTQQRLKQANPPICSRLVLQIHDELVWELPAADVHRAAAMIKDVMENCGRECGLAITLPVAISVGANWGDMQELTLL